MLAGQVQSQNHTLSPERLSPRACWADRLYSPPAGEKFNWGQININLVNQRGESLRGAERFLVLQYEEAPLRLSPL
jgi:hypothetical protein